MVQHFGDQEDRGERCGICDICAPQSAVALIFRKPTPAEQQRMERLLDSLRIDNGQTSGRLHGAVFGNSLSRNDHEELIGALVRAEMVLEQHASFEKDGRVIEYKRVMLTPEGRQAKNLDGVLIVAEPDDVDSTAPAPAQRTARSRKPGKSKRKKQAQLSMDPEEAQRAAPPELVEALQAWRREASRKRDVPAYCVLHNRTLLTIAATRPQSESELLAVKGMGPARVEQHGEAILALTRHQARGARSATDEH
jgi:DNA topoisomerase-3